MKKLVVAIGDIHGCLDEFKELLNTIQFNKETMRVVLLGDILDRGPDSAGCVRLARELNLESILGNHEDRHLRWRRHEKNLIGTGKPNPMRKSIDKIRTYKTLSEDDFEWISKLPLKLELLPNIWALHGGLEPKNDFEKQSPSQIIRVRFVDANGSAVPLGENFSQPPNSVYWSEAWKGEQNVVYGHCVHDFLKPKLDWYNNFFRLGIDTGCCFGGNLTAAIFKNNYFEFVHVPAKQKYFKGPGEE